MRWSAAPCLTEMPALEGVWIHGSRPDRFHRPWTTGIALALAIALFCLIRPAPAVASAGWLQLALPGVLVHSLARSPLDSRVWLAGGSGGLWRSEDGAQTWQPVYRSPSQIWAVGWTDDGESALAAGLGSAPFKDSSDRGRTWHETAAGLSGRAAYAVIALDPAGASILLGTDQGVYLSTDAGVSWQPTDGLGPGTGVDALLPVPGRILAGLVPGGVAESTDGGRNWHAVVGTLGGGGGVMSLASPSGRSQVTAGTMGHAVWAQLSAAEWAARGDGLPSLAHGSALVADPDRPGVMYVGTLGQGVYKTTDGGGRWRPLTSGLSGNSGIVLSLALSPTDDALIAATASGLYRFPGVSQVDQAGDPPSPVAQLIPILAGRNALDAVVYVVHLISVFAWVATLIVGGASLVATLRFPANLGPVWLGLRPRILPVFLVLSLAAIGTGVYNTIYNSVADSPVTSFAAANDLLHTGYGVTLAIKHGVIVGVFLLAFLLWRQGRLADLAVAGTAPAPGAVRRASVLLVLLSLLIVALLLIAGLLPFEHHLIHEISIPGT